MRYPRPCVLMTIGMLLLASCVASHGNETHDEDADVDAVYSPGASACFCIWHAIYGVPCDNAIAAKTEACITDGEPYEQTIACLTMCCDECAQDSSESYVCNSPYMDSLCQQYALRSADPSQDVESSLMPSAEDDSDSDTRAAGDASSTEDVSAGDATEVTDDASVASVVSSPDENSELADVGASSADGAPDGGAAQSDSDTVAGATPFPDFSQSETTMEPEEVPVLGSSSIPADALASEESDVEAESTTLSAGGRPNGPIACECLYRASPDTDGTCEEEMATDSGVCTTVEMSSQPNDCKVACCQSCVANVEASWCKYETIINFCKLPFIARISLRSIL